MVNLDTVPSTVHFLYSSRHSNPKQPFAMDEAKEKFFQCHDDTKSAFDELCAMVDALNVSTDLS